MVKVAFGAVGLLVKIVFGLKGLSTAFTVAGGNFTLKSFKQSSRRGATTLHDYMTDIEKNSPNIYFFDEVESTMTKARELMTSKLDTDLFAVVAGHQTAGKGTRGRTWISGYGNLFLTIVIRRSSIPTPLMLIPLRVGTLVIPSIQSRVTSGALTVLKWPNDVLIGEEKVCGVLIEVEGDFMLIGIGCNIMTAPSVETAGVNNGRQSTCLARHITSCISSSADDQIDHSNLTDTCPSLGELHKEIAAEIYGALTALILQPKETAEQVVVDFERYMDFSPQRLRGDTNAGETVTPLKINKDGTLQVRVSSDNSEKTLIAEYLW